MKKFVTLAVKSRNNEARWYSRITISEKLANLAKFTPGMRVQVSSTRDSITVAKNDCGNLKFPKLKGKRNLYFPLEVAADKLNLSHTKHEEVPMDFQVTEGVIVFSVPEVYFSDKPKVVIRTKRKYISVYARRKQAALLQNQIGDGVGLTIILEGLRSGIKVRPVGIKEVINYFENQGNQMVQLNPRHYKMDDTTINVSNLSELYSRLHGANYWNPIVLIME